VSTSPPPSEVDLPPDPVFGTLNELATLLHDLDDRGLVLSLAAFAEDALGSLLQAFMVPSEATKQLLDGFNAPLGTFSARIKACLALGLITKHQYDDLEHLRKIRNEFAHHWRHISLSSRSLAGHVNALSYGTLTNHFPETPAEKVRGSLTSLLSALRSLIHTIGDKKWQARVRESSLIAGFAMGTFEEQFVAAKTEFEALRAARDAAAGERRKFQEFLLRRFRLKIELLQPSCPLDVANELAELRASVDVAIGDLVQRYSRPNAA
jgi:hypothetical protein